MVSKVVTLVAYRLLLDALYVFLISDVFAYAGFNCTWELFNYTASFIAFIIFICFYPTRITRPSHFFMAYCITFLVIPLTTLYAFTNQGILSLVCVLLPLTIIHLILSLKPWRLGRFSTNKLLVILTLALITLGTLFIIILRGGLGYFNLNFAEVYNYREDLNTISDGMIAYWITWVSKVIVPFFVVVSYHRRRFLITVLLFLLQLFIFGITSHKSVIFYPIISLFGYIFLMKVRKGISLPVVSSIVVLFFWFIFVFTDLVLLPSLVLRRTYFVPSYLYFAYIDFFQDNPKIFWSNSFLANFVDYPYQFSSSTIVARSLGETSGANTTFLATGYMHGGLLGSTFYGILLGLVFRLIDSMRSRNMPASVVLGIMLPSVISLMVNSDLMTALLTHGIAFAIVIIYFYRR